MRFAVGDEGLEQLVGNLRRDARAGIRHPVRSSPPGLGEAQRERARAELASGSIVERLPETRRRRSLSICSVVVGGLAHCTTMLRDSNSGRSSPTSCSMKAA